jgi:hypothetical protein
MELESRIKRLEKAFRLTLGNRLPAAPRVGGLPRADAILKYIDYFRRLTADPRFESQLEQIEKRIAECQIAYHAERDFFFRDRPATA